MSTPTAKTKHPGGRPTKYTPALCARVVALGRQGKSKCQIAAKLNVVRDTLYEWAERYPEFSDAITRARELEMAWWEEAGQKGIRAKQFNAQLWSRSMAARFPADYRESIKHDVNAQVTNTNLNVDTKRLSDAELREIIRRGTPSAEGAEAPGNSAS